VRLVADALIQSRQLEPETCTRLYTKIAQRIDYYQSRNALARACHTRAAIRELHRIGIKLTNLRNCEENTS
jgi:hypothetical protein